MAEDKKGASIFDFIDGVTHKKKEWSKWSEMDQSKFSPFISMSIPIQFGAFNTLAKYSG